MSDCANVEIRELLPEYLHDRLGAPQRALVEAHLSDCEDCSAELGTLPLRISPACESPTQSAQRSIMFLGKPLAFKSVCAWIFS